VVRACAWCELRLPGDLRQCLHHVLSTLHSPALHALHPLDDYQRPGEDHLPGFRLARLPFPSPPDLWISGRMTRWTSAQRQEHLRELHHCPARRTLNNAMFLMLD
jgi:hypothetical protein